MVKFVHSASVAWGSQVLIPGLDLHTAQLNKPCCGGIPHKIEEDGHNVSSGRIFLSKKRKERALVMGEVTRLVPNKKRKV